MSEVSDPVFAKIAQRYDRINRILSLGREQSWRAVGVELLEPGLVLDLGCGTGDTDFDGRPVIGLDPVIEMLALSPVPARVVGVGEQLPLQDESVEGVFSAFVFRNLTSIDHTLEEIDRVLQPGCSAVVIDLSRPSSPFLRFLHRIGTAIVLPLVGLLFARAPREYWYLNQTLDSLPPPEILFARRSLVLEEVWRSGVFGFVYGVRLRKGRKAAEEESPEAA
ncbi:MAG TPA: class I SAM-dependent methyltransferase [Acidimicrobiia bacterium]|nr:class I SAM-dependent methyltransferase [Acidimicrobiia bacterium]